MKKTATKKPAKAKAAKKPAPKGKTAKKELRYFETGFRLRRAEKEALTAQGLHVYSRRDNGRENTIEPSVGVDFMGTIITNFPIKFKKSGPEAYTIYNGDTYLKDIGAKEVNMVSQLNAKARKGKAKR